MEKLKLMSDELFNRYRIDFIDFVDSNPQLFSGLMTEMLTQYNLKKNNGYQNYIGSDSYNKTKFSLYEMIFRSYARIRLRYESQFELLKQKKLSPIEYISVVKARVGDQLTIPNKKLFRSSRDRGFIRVLGVSWGMKGLNGDPLEYSIAKRLSNMGPSNNEDYMKIFATLSKDEKERVYIEKAQKSIENLEQNYQFKLEKKREEPLEN